MASRETAPEEDGRHSLSSILIPREAKIRILNFISTTDFNEQMAVQNIIDLEVCRSSKLAGPLKYDEMGTEIQRATTYSC